MVPLRVINLRPSYRGDRPGPCVDNKIDGKKNVSYQLTRSITHRETQANRAIRKDRDRPVVSCRGKGAKHFFDNPAVLDFGNPECKFGKESAWALGDSELEGRVIRNFVRQSD